MKWLTRAAAALALPLAEAAATALARNERLPDELRFVAAALRDALRGELPLRR